MVVRPDESILLYVHDDLDRQVAAVAVPDLNGASITCYRDAVSLRRVFCCEHPGTSGTEHLYIFASGDVQNKGFAAG